MIISVIKRAKTNTVFHLNNVILIKEGYIFIRNKNKSKYLKK